MDYYERCFIFREILLLLAEQKGALFDDMANIENTDVDNISEEELYKLGLTFFKLHEGKSFHLNYQDKLQLVAYSQQANQGSFKEADLPPLGTFDLVGKERRAAWEALGDISREDAKEKFSSRLLELAPAFQDFIIQESKKKVEREAAEEQEKVAKAEQEVQTKQREEQRIKEEQQRRAIQDALNRQTFDQFKSYAEQQYPGRISCELKNN